MKKFYFLQFLLSIFFIQAQENYVQIFGSTNVNQFKCINNSFKFLASNMSLDNSNLPTISLKVAEFDCRNSIMTNDFKKTLSAEKFPLMNIKFLSLTKTQNNYIALIEVKIMNQSRKYNIEFDLQNNNRLIGKERVKFSDFNITPPKRMGGMIVVKDDLDLTFSLAAKN